MDMITLLADILMGTILIGFTILVIAVFIKVLKTMFKSK